MLKQLQVDEETKKLQNNSGQENVKSKEQIIEGPHSNAARIDSAPDVPIQKMTPSGSPLLRNNKPFIESKNDEPANPAITPFQATSKKMIQFTGVKSQASLNKQCIERIPFEKYHRNGNVTFEQLKLPSQPGIKLEFGPLFILILGLSFPFGILFAYISSEFDSGAFTFVNCWLFTVFFTFSFIQQLFTYKNGLCNYILSKAELDYWNEPKFIKIVWGIRICLLIINMCLTIYYGYSVWNDNISDSILSIFIFLAILTLINLIFVIFIFYAIIPANNKQLITIKERIEKLERLQENIQIPLSFVLLNKILGIYQHGQEGNIYQSTIASQNYQKFICEFEERQIELLIVAKSRNDKLSHETTDFVNKLYKEFRDKKDNQQNGQKLQKKKQDSLINYIQMASNPGIAPFDILINYISFFFLQCIGFPVLLYFAQGYQEINNQYLPILFFLYPFAIYVCKRFTLGFFQMKQFVDYVYEAKIVILGVIGYRIGTMSVQRLGVEYFIEMLLIKFACKILYYWIAVFGYYFSLERSKELFMSYIRGSTVDQSQQKNNLSTRRTTLIQSAVAQVKEKKNSIFEPQEADTPSFSKTAANWIHVDNIENIKKALITKQIFGFMIQEIFEIILGLLFIILSAILYNETENPQKWSTFDVTQDEHSTFQLEIGIEIVIEFAFCITTIALFYKQLKIPNTYSFFQQIQHIIGNDGLKSLIYDYCFAIVICFLIVANKFEIK